MFRHRIWSRLLYSPVIVVRGRQSRTRTKGKHELPRLWCWRQRHADAVCTKLSLVLCVSSMLRAQTRRSSSSSLEAKYLETRPPRPDQVNCLSLALLMSSLALLLCILRFLQDD